MASAATSAGSVATRGRRAGESGRTTPLRVDAQRNLEHVLRAAREVFGELGYGAPMEDVARRARVGVGTVYRRFPSKDVLVRRIAAEETSRLTEQARAALGQEDDAWSALSRFLRTSVASGAGRLLPPQVLQVSVEEAPEAAAEGTLVPQQRQGDARYPAGPGLRLVGRTPSPDRAAGLGFGRPAQVGAPDTGAIDEADDAGAAELLDVVGQLVQRAHEAGELREDVAVADVLLVIATSAPALPDPAQQAASSARVLEILLEGLRARGVRETV
ncbi:TetR/AcrR family transcriptional regulator [Streptomyces sp. NA04227]|uniref:TetR/AcrR family transcriptional regulator n=1 Tax=Streptomyces sp. NA04227 TaxID=2742136 RepID=UPI0020CA706D|nr:helix-turn-helix domain-containing protein [Streptomyces sp. NA04227]